MRVAIIGSGILSNLGRSTSRDACPNRLKSASSARMSTAGRRWWANRPLRPRRSSSKINCGARPIPARGSFAKVCLDLIIRPPGQRDCFWFQLADFDRSLLANPDALGRIKEMAARMPA